MKKLKTLISAFLLIWGVFGSSGAALITFDDLITGETSYGFGRNRDSMSNTDFTPNESPIPSKKFPNGYVGSNYISTVSLVRDDLKSDNDITNKNYFEGTFGDDGNDPVSESATMFLLGTGLICLAGASRKAIFRR